MFNNRQLDRIERAIADLARRQAEHEARQNGHQRHTFRGIPLVYWLVGLLLAGVLGSDLIIDTLTAFGRLGG